MNFTEILNAIIQYGSIFMGVLLVLVTSTTMVVEVLKRLLPKIPTDLVVFVVAIGLTFLAIYIAATVFGVEMLWYCWIGAVAIGFAVAYAAMFGWEKFHELWSRVKDLFKGQ